MTHRNIVKICIIFVLALSMMMVGKTTSLLGQTSDNGAINLNQTESGRPEVLRIPVNVGGEPASWHLLDPWFYRNPVVPSWWPLVYSQLIDYDVDAKTYVPKLANDWYSDFNGTVWTFTLRENVYFHDGSKFDSLSILAEFDRGKDMKTSGLLNPENSQHSDLFDLIDSITIHSKYQLSFNLVKPFSTFLPKLVDLYFAAPSASIDGPIVDRIGSGPYIYDEVNSNGLEKIFNRNKLYFEGLPPFKVIEMIDIHSSDQETAMRDNEVDILPIYFHDFQMEDITYIVRADPIVYQFGVYNTQNPILSDAKVRRALNFAVDHARLNEELHGIFGETFNDFRNQNYSVFPGAANNAPQVQNQYNYDLSEAVRLLDEAGYQLNSNRNRFNLTIVSGNGGFHDVAVDVIRESFESLGIGVIWERVSSDDEWISKLRILDFDIWIGARAPTVPDPFESSETLITEGFFNNGHYSNQTLDDLYSAITKTAIRNEQYHLYSQIADHMKDEAPLLQIDSWGMIHPIRKNVVDYVTIGSLNRYSFKYLDEEKSTVITSEITNDDSQIYSSRLNLGITKSEDQDFKIQKSESLSNINERWEIHGEELFGFNFNQLNTVSNYQISIFLEPDSKINLNEVKVHILENNELQEIDFDKDTGLLELNFETTGDKFITVSKGDLQLEILPEIEILPEKESSNFLTSGLDLAITLGLSIMVVLGFSFDYYNKNAGKYDGLKYNLHRYRLYLPEKSKIALSVIYGFVLTSGFLLLGRIASSIGIIAMQKDKDNIKSEVRPEVVRDGQTVDSDQFAIQDLQKSKVEL